MRIRSTKPEFWRSLFMQVVAPTVVFDGPLPTGPRCYMGLAPVRSGSEYVYLLFDATDRLLYVGRSWRPADRFTKHRRKPWWGEVSSLVILRVDGDDQHEASALTAALESRAIKRLSPAYNIAGVSR